MERKIGEIFEFGGEWYQCVESDSCGECSLFTTECGSGTKSDLADKVFGQCSRVRRSDNKHAIFKKLEKVGEPFYSKYYGKFYQMYKTYIPAVGSNFKIRVTPVEYVGRNEIFIEIKQTKEDMEEKKQCGDNRFMAIARAKEHLFQATNIAEDKKELEVLDSFLLRCWQMGWLKQYEDAEEKKLNLKPFDIQKAREGKPVCTRDGRKVRIICFDRVDADNKCNIVALIERDGEEIVRFYDELGNQGGNNLNMDNYDLMMLSKKKEGWVNVYKGGLLDTKSYPTKKEAFDKACPEGYVDTIKISWSE